MIFVVENSGSAAISPINRLLAGGSREGFVHTPDIGEPLSAEGVDAGNDETTTAASRGECDNDERRLGGGEFSFIFNVRGFV
mgnify:CR=1 FL=1